MMKNPFHLGNLAQWARADQNRQRVLELVLEAGIDGIGREALCDEIRQGRKCVQLYLRALEALGKVERSQPSGKGLVWGPPGTAAHHQKLLRERGNRQETRRLMYRLEKIDTPDDVDDWPVVRSVVAANSAGPIVKPCPASVWELAA